MLQNHFNGSQKHLKKDKFDPEPINGEGTWGKPIITGYDKHTFLSLLTIALKTNKDIKQDITDRVIDLEIVSNAVNISKMRTVRCNVIINNTDRSTYQFKKQLVIHIKDGTTNKNIVDTQVGVGINSWVTRISHTDEVSKFPNYDLKRKLKQALVYGRAGN